jgi:hypothetical protein
MKKFIVLLFAFVSSINIVRSNDDAKKSLAIITFSDNTEERVLISNDEFKFLDNLIIKKENQQ